MLLIEKWSEFHLLNITYLDYWVVLRTQVLAVHYELEHALSGHQNIAAIRLVGGIIAQPHGYLMLEDGSKYVNFMSG